MTGPRSAEAARIAQMLTHLPGIHAVDVNSKRFARLGPAEADTPYEEKFNSFAARDLPEALPVVPNADEMTITLRGTLLDASANLADAAHGLFDDLAVGTRWNLRVEMPKVPPRSSTSPYQVTVFHDAFGGGDRVPPA